MKRLFMTLMLVFIAIPAMAQEHNSEQSEGWLKPVEAKFVCMVTNQSYDTPQISVEVEGKTYYGCCPMCKEKLANDPAMRSAVDPVSGNSVNKADAVIGSGSNGMVYYFENEENFQKYANGPIPEMNHGHMEGMDMKGMEETPEGHESHH